MGKLFFDFRFWTRGYRTAQTAHCAVGLTLLSVGPTMGLPALQGAFSANAKCKYDMTMVDCVCHRHQTAI